MGKAHKKASSSAVFSCVAAAIPFPSVKAKQPGIMTASFGAGAIALAADVAKQYEALEKELPFSKKIEKINWAQSFRKAGTQSLIAGISAGVVLYAADHPRFRNFAGKIKKLSYERVEKLLKKSGFSGETAEEFCKRFGVRRATKEAGKFFDLSVFKNLTARIPSGRKLTNLRKSEFITYGYKVKPESGGLKAAIDDIAANGDRLGTKTEGLADDIMTQSGYAKLDGRYGNNNGYDGVYIKGDINNPTEIVIVESKQFKYVNNKAEDIIEHGGVTLNRPSGRTPLPAQMSDEWVEYLADKLILSPNTQLLGSKIKQLMRLDRSKISKYVSAVDKMQGEINFLKLGQY